MVVMRGVLGVDHNEGDVHFAAARLLGKQPGLDIVGVDERLLRRAAWVPRAPAMSPGWPFSHAVSRSVLGVPA